MTSDNLQTYTYYDKKTLLARIMNNHELLNTLLKVFIEDMPIVLNKLKLAFSENNLEQVVAEAHSLKGASYNLTAHQIGHLAQEVEENGKQRNVEKIEVLLPELGEQLKLTVEYFEHILANS